MKITHLNWPYYFVGPPNILLDGVEVTEVLEADDEDGTVKRYQTNESGTVIHAGGQYLTEVLNGKVEIVGERRTDL